jgi:two-component system CheB/CheR fusion protein
MNKKRPSKPKKSANKSGAKGGKDPSEIEQAGKEQRFPIVGIGASAGGLEAFDQFFSKMPADGGMAFVLVPHLDPRHASMMAELLRRVTSMEVAEAKDGMKVETNHVYVIPPDKEMSIYHGTLNLEPPKMTHGLRMPIDSFFRSLAEDQGEMGAVIILSGTGSDGTLGLRAVHGAGGMVMVQDPTGAKYAGMPASALQTGLADYVLPPEKMPSQLISYFSQSIMKKEKFPVIERREDSLRKILALVRSQTAHDFSLYKKTTLNRRIEKRMTLHGIEDIVNYVRFLREHPEEVQALFKDLVIGVTNFFRDLEAFETLRRKILPKYLESKPGDYSYRAWVPGCGTGEEAFSIAIALMETMEEMKRDVKVQIFGTDIDEEAINQARTGFYSSNIAGDVSPDRLRRFFIKEAEGYRVKKEVREMVVFAMQDVIKDPPFTKLDLLSCRNLLIYLEPELQNKLLPLFHYSLKPEGILFLGSSETIGQSVDLFEVMDKKWKFFKSKKNARVVQEELWTTLPWSHAYVPKNEAEEIRKPKPLDVGTLAQKALLETFAHPSVIVDEKGEIVYVHGQTGKYLEPAPGHASFNVLDMAREGIKYELRSGLHHVVTRAKERRYRGLQVKTDGGYETVNLSVKPLAQSKENQSLVLVAFEEVSPEKPPPKRKRRGPQGEPQRRIQELEQELAYTRESHQATVEELQAANEELKSTNEELQSTNEEFQSTNEELETSREELQSVNEELVTLNSELQAKIDQLSRTENDMKVLLDSTNIGIIFLDRSLRIKRFTSEATKVFSLIPTDIDRPIHDIRSTALYDDIEKDAQAVLETLQPRENEIQSKDGKWYLMRIIPYQSAEGMIDGVVITFTDTTEIRRTDRALSQEKITETALRLAESIVNTVREPLLVLDDELRVICANRSFYNAFGVVKEETEGRLVYELGDRQWDIPELKTRLSEVLSLSSAFDDFAVEHDFPGVGRKELRLNARKIGREVGADRPMVLLAIEDMTDRKKNP